MAELEISVPASKVRKRLLEALDYTPWVRAEEQQMPDCFLFWLPVSAFPISHQERVWLMEFLSRLTARLHEQHALRAELFLAYKSITGDLMDIFRRYAVTCVKMIGLGRFADTELPPMPTPAQVKECVESGKTFRVRDWVGDYLIWFVGKDKEQQRELFFGRGGTTTIFLPPDPKIKVPNLPFTPALRASLPVFQRMDVDGTIAGAFSMQEEFLDKSKAMFGAGLESRSEYQGMAFILPLLESAHFFLASAELRAQWFELFDVYLNESEKDKGIVLAFKQEKYLEDFLSVLESMRTDRILYRKEEAWKPRIEEVNPV
jgi:hypothetical protein